MGTNEQFVEDEWAGGWTMQVALYVIAILLARMLDENAPQSGT